MFTFVLLATAAFAAGPDETSLSGKWQVERNAAGNQKPAGLHLHAKSE